MQIIKNVFIGFLVSFIGSIPLGYLNVIGFKLYPNLFMRQLKISKQFTNRENKSLDKYLNEISKVQMIDAQEEVELARRIREGDQAALEKLVNANLRFVVSVSKQ